MKSTYEASSVYIFLSMPSSTRHNRLSQPSESSREFQPRRPRTARARTVEALVKTLEKEQQVEQKQLEAETRQLDKYLNMGLRHLPTDDVIINMPDAVFRKFVVALLLATFYRSACSSTKEIETLCGSILEKLQSGKLSDIEKSQIETRVCEFLLGKCGIDVSQTLEETEFSGTAELKKLFLNQWKKDSVCTVFAKLDIKDLLRIRQRLTEKLNIKIYKLFEQQRGTTSAYAKALTSASQKISARMIAMKNLPLDYEIELRFSKEVCRILKVFDIVTEWAALYGEEPSRSLIIRLPTILNNRAVKKGQESMYSVCSRLIKMIKENRTSAETEDDTMSLSQPSLFLSQLQESPPISQKRYQTEIEKICDLTMTDDEEESSSDLMSILEKSVPGFSRQDVGQKTPTPPQKPLPPRQQKAVIFPSPPKAKPTIQKRKPPQKRKPVPTFSGLSPSVSRKRVATSEREGKKMKPSFLDGLPPLEEI